MGQFPIVYTERTVSGRAPSVRGDIDTRTGAGAMGQAIGQGLIDLAQLGIKWYLKEGNTQFAKYKSDVDKDNIVLLAEIENEHDADKHPAIYEKHANIRKGFLPKNNAGLRAAELWDIQQSAIYEKNLADGMKKRVNENWLASAYEQIADIERTGDPAKLIDFKKFLTRGIIIDKEHPDVQGRPLDRTQYVKLLAQANEAQVVGQVTSLYQTGNYKEAREVLESSSLSIKEKKSLSITIDADKNRKLSESIAIEKQQQKDLERDLFDGILDGTKDINDIRDSNLSAEAKRRLIKDINNNAIRDTKGTWGIVDREIAIKTVTAIKNRQEAGQTDIVEARKELQSLAEQELDGRSVISRNTYEKTLEQINKGGRDAIEKFSDEETNKIRNVLIKRLSEDDARLKARELAGTITPALRRQARSVSFLMQVNEHQMILFNNELNASIRRLGIENVSGVEARAEAAKLWETYKLKTQQERISEFIKFSGENIQKPIGFPQESWNTASPEDRAAVLNGLSRGLTVKEILEIIAK